MRSRCGGAARSTWEEYYAAAAAPCNGAASGPDRTQCRSARHRAALAAQRCGPRRHGHVRRRADGDAVRSLWQRRHQPPPGRDSRGGGRGDRDRGPAALSRALPGTMSDARRFLDRHAGGRSAHTRASRNPGVPEPVLPATGGLAGRAGAGSQRQSAGRLCRARRANGDTARSAGLDGRASSGAAEPRLKLWACARPSTSWCAAVSGPVP